MKDNDCYCLKKKHMEFIFHELPNNNTKLRKIIAKLRRDLELITSNKYLEELNEIEDFNEYSLDLYKGLHIDIGNIIENNSKKSLSSTKQRQLDNKVKSELLLEMMKKRLENGNDLD